VPEDQVNHKRKHRLRAVLCFSAKNSMQIGNFFEKRLDFCAEVWYNKYIIIVKSEDRSNPAFRFACGVCLKMEKQRSVAFRKEKGNEL